MMKALGILNVNICHRFWYILYKDIITMFDINNVDLVLFGSCLNQNTEYVKDETSHCFKKAL